MNTSFDKILDDMVKVYDDDAAVNVVESGDNNNLNADDLEKRLSDMIDKKLSEVAKNTERKGEEKKEENTGTQKQQTAETINEEKESEDSENG